MQLTAFDKQLLNLIQSGLPLTPAPFADIARQLGSDERSVIERIDKLQERGLICRFGAFFDFPPNAGVRAAAAGNRPGRVEI